MDFLYIFYIIVGMVACVAFVASTMHRFTIHEGFVGLLYRKGKFLRQLQPGEHTFFGRGYKVEDVDLRRQSTIVAGQELLTAEHLPIKLSLALQFRVADPLALKHSTVSWQHELHLISQLALRHTVTSRELEALLAERDTLGGELLAAIAPRASELGVELIAVDIRDIMLPAEVRRANSDVVKARREGQAALERARGETAALRSLANAARMLESNPGLYNLRILQTLNAGGGNTMVLNVPNGLIPLKPTINDASSPRPAEEGFE